MIRALVKAVMWMINPQQSLKNRRIKSPSLMKHHRVKKTNHSSLENLKASGRLWMAAVWNQPRLILHRPQCSRIKGKNYLLINSLNRRMAPLIKTIKATGRREPTKMARVMPTSSSS